MANSTILASRAHAGRPAAIEIATPPGRRARLCTAFRTQLLIKLARGFSQLPLLLLPPTNHAEHDSHPTAQSREAPRRARETAVTNEWGRNRLETCNRAQVDAFPVGRIEGHLVADRSHSGRSAGMLFSNFGSRSRVVDSGCRRSATTGPLARFVLPSSFPIRFRQICRNLAELVATRFSLLSRHLG